MKLFKLGDKIFCNKRKLNGILEGYKNNFFIIKFENNSYGKYTQETMLTRFVLVEKPRIYKNVLFVDFINKRIAV